MTKIHKKTIVLLITCLIVIGGIFALVRYQKMNAPLYTQQQIDESEEMFKQITEKDSDSDGLKDWEEDLWKSDKTKTDTDGDGTSDGEEIKLGRNPLVKGPSDKILDTTQINTGIASSTSTTDTARFARDFFVKYMMYKQSGVPFTEGNQLDLIDATLKEAPVPFSKKYKLSDVRTHTDNSPLALKVYGNAVGMILSAHAIKSENEGVILKRSIEEEDPEEIKKLDPIIASYKAINAKLAELIVPSSAQAIHVALLDSFSGIIEVIQGFRAVHSDPYRALIGLGTYVPATQNLFNSLAALRDYFIKNKVTFGPEDPGSVFFPKP